MLLDRQTTEYSNLLFYNALHICSKTFVIFFFVKILRHKFTSELNLCTGKGVCDLLTQMLFTLLNASRKVCYSYCNLYICRAN
jgi:hypothetical protein